MNLIETLKSNPKVRADISQFLKISPEKTKSQYIELIKISKCIDIAEQAYLNLDMEYKNPIVSNHLKRIKDSANEIKKQLKNHKKYGFSHKQSDYAEEAACELYMLISYAIRFGKEGIVALNEYLRVNLDEPEQFVAYVNNLVTNFK